MSTGDRSDTSSRSLRGSRGREVHERISSSALVPALACDSLVSVTNAPAAGPGAARVPAVRARGPHRWLTASLLALLASLWALPAHAEPTLRKIGEMELSLLGLSAGVDPEAPVVPKNVASAVRVVVRAGARELSASEVADFLGAGFEVRAELSGPGLTATLSLPDRDPGDPLPADPFLLHFPPLPTSGDYTLANVRIESGGRTVLDARPSNVPLKVIERVLVTSVKTRPLTLDEIVARGIDLADAENYLGLRLHPGSEARVGGGPDQVPRDLRSQGSGGAGAAQAAAGPTPRLGPGAADSDAAARAAPARGRKRRRSREPPARAGPARRRAGDDPGSSRDPGRHRLSQAVLLRPALRRQRGPGRVRPRRE